MYIFLLGLNFINTLFKCKLLVYMVSNRLLLKDQKKMGHKFADVLDPSLGTEKQANYYPAH